MLVVPRQLWLALEYQSTPEHHLVDVRTSFGLIAEPRRRTVVLVAIPTEALFAAGSLAALGITFCCCFGFLSSVSQAVAARQILSSVAMVL